MGLVVRILHERISLIAPIALERNVSLSHCPYLILPTDCPVISVSIYSIHRRIIFYSVNGILFYPQNQSAYNFRKPLPPDPVI